jgi:uncharacterized protein (TIGR00299 family) protein
MFLGALVQLAAAHDDLTSLPQRLGLQGVKVTIRQVVRCGLAATKVDVTCPPEAGHPHRHLKDITKLIDQAELPQTAKERALEIFQLLAEAEASVHGVDVQQVHFHEVGAWDALVDIVGVAWLLEQLGVSRCVCSPVCTGHGFVEAAHGRLSIPAPATAALLAGMPVFRGSVPHELTTPTGAAILRSMKPDFSDTVAAFEAPVYGAGTADFKQPNVLRLSLNQGHSDGRDVEHEAGLCLLQSNLDNTSSEFLGTAFQQRCLDAGALDLTLAPVTMKKGRPGLVLEVLCRQEHKQGLVNLILTELNTLGVRQLQVGRYVLPREVRTLQTDFGPVRFKCAQLPGGGERCLPEFEDCEALAHKHGMSPAAVQRHLLSRH